MSSVPLPNDVSVYFFILLIVCSRMPIIAPINSSSNPPFDFLAIIKPSKSTTKAAERSFASFNRLESNSSNMVNLDISYYRFILYFIFKILNRFFSIFIQGIKHIIQFSLISGNVIFVFISTK